MLKQQRLPRLHQQQQPTHLRALKQRDWYLPESNLAAALETSDTVSFDWKAENGADSFDVFGYFINETTGNTYTVLKETGTTSTWQTVTFSIPEEGAYRFVFISGSYDETGGQALGASLYLDNILVNADLRACEALQNQ